MTKSIRWIASRIVLAIGWCVALVLWIPVMMVIAIVLSIEAIALVYQWAVLHGRYGGDREAQDEAQRQDVRDV